MPSLRALPELLSRLAAEGRLRVPDDEPLRVRLEAEWGSDFLDASSNDYLGLARSVSRETPVVPGEGSPGVRAPERTDVSRETSPPGAGASRLIHGTHPAHLAVERRAAEWLGMDAALLFASGYAANVGALGALLGPEDLVVSDALNHASLIDGIRLGRARVVVAPHRSLEAVERALAEPSTGARWVVVESYYSMDGDAPDLRGLRELCDRSGAHLYVDEAHGLGVFGPRGAGLCAERGVRPDVLVGAFGKAVGSHGAVVAGSASLRTWLWNRARSFVFSTAPTPRHAESLLGQIVATQAADDLRARLRERSEQLRAALETRGIVLAPDSFGPIVSLVLGAEERALAVAGYLRAHGVLVQAIRPPTVPVGASRLRLTVGAQHAPGSLERLADAVAAALASESELR